MKKGSMILLALFITIGIFILEGGRLASLLTISAFIPLFLGPLITALFCFTMAEVNAAFSCAFAERLDLDRLNDYHMSLAVVKHLESSVLLWASTLVVLALIGILSSVTEIDQLGSSVAVGMVALFYAFGLKTFLLEPMRFSIIKKLIQAGEYVV